VRRRRHVILVAWLPVLAGLGVSIGGFATAEGDAPAMTFIAGMVMFLGGVIYGVIAARMITVVQIDDDSISFDGVCAEYRAELPDWDD